MFERGFYFPNPHLDRIAIVLLPPPHRSALTAPHFPLAIFWGGGFEKLLFLAFYEIGWF